MLKISTKESLTAQQERLCLPLLGAGARLCRVPGSGWAALGLSGAELGLAGVPWPSAHCPACLSSSSVSATREGADSPRQCLPDKQPWGYRGAVGYQTFTVSEFLVPVTVTTPSPTWGCALWGEGPTRPAPGHPAEQPCS